MNCRLDYSWAHFFRIRRRARRHSPFRCYPSRLTAEAIPQLAANCRLAYTSLDISPGARYRHFAAGLNATSLTGGRMRLRILTRPTGTIDGVSLDYFHVGRVYEVGSQVACVFLAEGWAELVSDDDSAVFVR